MKNILAIIFAFAFAFSVNAQFVAGPAVGSGVATAYLPFLLTNNTASITMASATYGIIPVGQRGVGLAITVASTNSATTTNVAFILEGSVDGTYFHANAGSIPIVYVTPTGNASTTSYTNLQATAANIGNIRYYRLKTITNGNWQGIWVSNITWSVLQ